MRNIFLFFLTRAPDRSSVFLETHRLLKGLMVGLTSCHLINMNDKESSQLLQVYFGKVIV